jgi:hypothetical protein
MGSFLRRPGVFCACVVALALAVGVVEPAQAGKGNGRGKHGQDPADAGYEQPAGLVGNDHAKAKGHEKKASEAPVVPADSNVGEPEGGAETKQAEQSVESAPAGKQQGSGDRRSEDAHHHVIVCHRTGSSSNPYVVINIPWTAWSEAHSPGSGHAHPALDSRVDKLLADPASRPGGKDGFSKADCVSSPVDPPVDPPTPPPPPVDPPAPPPVPEGPRGPLGDEGNTPGQGHLPFTGFPVLVVVLATLGAAVSAAGIARGAGKKGQGF